MEVWQKGQNLDKQRKRREKHDHAAPLLPIIMGTPLSLLDAEKKYILYDFSVRSVSTVFEEHAVYVLFCDGFLSFWFAAMLGPMEQGWYP